MRPRSRWFPPPALMLLLLMLLLIVLSLHPRLSYSLHARCCSRLLKWHTPTMSCWKSRRSCSSRGLPRKQAHQGLSDATRPLLHIDLHADMPRHAALYTLCYLHTHTHIHTERGESSKLRRGFVPLMNLQRDSIESPFTYMYVINTTYYYSSMTIMSNGYRKRGS